MNMFDVMLLNVVALENDIEKIQKELKKMKKISALQLVAIGYLLCRVGGKSVKEEVTIEEKVKEKCKKMFEKKRCKNENY